MQKGEFLSGVTHQPKVGIHGVGLFAYFLIHFKFAVQRSSNTENSINKNALLSKKCFVKMHFTEAKIIILV